MHMKEKKDISRRKLFVGFLAIATSITVVMLATLTLLSDDTLKKARASVDSISITASYCADSKTLTASQSISYKNRTGIPLDIVKFHIYANAYQEGAQNPPVTDTDIPQAYPNGKSFGGITINSLYVDNKKVTPIIDGDDDTVLIVALPLSLARNHTAQISIDYTVVLANIKHRLGWTDNVVNLANFYPVPAVFENGKWQIFPYSASGDPFYNHLHNFDVRLSFPADKIAASSGTLMRESTKDGVKTVHRRSTAIRDFAAVLSKDFKVICRTVGRVHVEYYYLHDYDPRKSLDISVKALRTFSNLFVKYPYRTLSIVQTDFLHGGMEYGELVYVSSAFLQQETPDRDQHNYVIVHEIAHQWWYGIIGNNQSSTAWIDEGLAEYSTLLFYDKHPEYNIKRDELIANARRNYSEYIRLVRGIGGELSTNMNRDLNSFNNTYEYVFMTYVRGLLLFYDLETMITRQTLLSALRDFAICSRFSFATQDNLVRCIEKSTGARVGLFFESYLLGWDGFKAA